VSLWEMLLYWIVFVVADIEDSAKECLEMDKLLTESEEEILLILKQISDCPA
jgi:hypothetical protein